ncbi:unnamed protein product [Echinostoma caproni]|uniref:L-seryl-tRNA(Sec) kinase n=1 Tax=Echinostoma caproni TaxID=27848 RepID=A0A183AUB3_9TREM|nr:unnamed protein product [Echinostoma caproni]
MTKVLLVTVIGLPGCGKSTFCSQLSSHMESSTPVLVLCYDSLIPKQAFCLNQVTETTNWRKWRQAVVHCVERLIVFCLELARDDLPTYGEVNAVWNQIQLSRIRPNHDLIVILDDNFYYTSMRRPFFCLAKQYNCGFASIQCDCPLDVCLKRNAIRSEPVEDRIIIQMAANFEPINPTENYWEKHSCHLDCSTSLTEFAILSVVQLLLRALEEPYSSAEEDALREQQSRDRQINADSVLHAVDNALRVHVRHVLESKELSWKKMHGKSIGTVKAHILAEIRSLLCKPDGVGSIQYYQDMAVHLLDKEISTMVEL